MAEEEPSKLRRAGRIKDARGRAVTQLDPVALHLLRQHDVIDSLALHAIVHEKGVGITTGERIGLVFGIIGAAVVAGLFTFALVTGDIGSAPYAKSAGLLYLCAIPWIIWYGIKRRRFGYVAAALLKHLRCPHCGYNLHGLSADSADAATTCPECGSAWRIGSGQRTKP